MTDSKARFFDRDTIISLALRTPLPGQKHNFRKAVSFLTGQSFPERAIEQPVVISRARDALLCQYPQAAATSPLKGIHRRRLWIEQQRRNLREEIAVRPLSDIPARVFALATVMSLYTGLTMNEPYSRTYELAVYLTPDYIDHPHQYNRDELAGQRFLLARAALLETRPDLMAVSKPKYELTGRHGEDINPRSSIGIRITTEWLEQQQTVFGPSIALVPPSARANPMPRAA